VQFNVINAHAASSEHYGAAVIDNNTPTPAYAQFSWVKFWRWLSLGAIIWLVTIAILALTQGWQATLTQMAWFFSKAAMLTFGGAYAVLPYVFQGAVDHYHWLTPQQMMDGLALGETTPGPLIMVVAFVGFVGGWGQQVLGADSLFLSGTLAACVVTFFTFLPSFLFIFIGAPLIESTHNNLTFTAPLNAISAAVVGVIVSLGVFFAEHVFIPKASVDVFAIVVALLSLGLLIKWNLSIIKLVLLCAMLGLLRYFIF
jgi:chromate transporter